MILFITSQAQAQYSLAFARILISFDPFFLFRAQNSVALGIQKRHKILWPILSFTAFAAFETPSQTNFDNLDLVLVSKEINICILLYSVARKTNYTFLFIKAKTLSISKENVFDIVFTPFFYFFTFYMPS